MNEPTNIADDREAAVNELDAEVERLRGAVRIKGESLRECQDAVSRLRRIEEAARAVGESAEWRAAYVSPIRLDALRAVLEDK